MFKFTNLQAIVYSVVSDYYFEREIKTITKSALKIENFTKDKTIKNS
jgi:hypothetical protein